MFLPEVVKHVCCFHLKVEYFAYFAKCWALLEVVDRSLLGTQADAWLSDMPRLVLLLSALGSAKPYDIII